MREDSMKARIIAAIEPKFRSFGDLSHGVAAEAVAAMLAVMMDAPLDVLNAGWSAIDGEKVDLEKVEMGDCWNAMIREISAESVSIRVEV